VVAESVLIVFLSCLLVSSYGFLLPRRRFVGQTNVFRDNVKGSRYIKMQLCMSNETSTQVDSKQEENVLRPILEFWGSSATNSAYRTFLLTGALFGSQSVREFLGLPGCFLIASVAFSVFYYETKFNYLVDTVTPERQAALKAIRQYKTDQLQSRIVSSSSTTENLLPTLLDAYEKALRKELSTRIIIPPNIWVIEMDPNQEDRSAARQFLGLEITDEYTLEPLKK